MTGKRWLYLIHRWLGIALCLLMAVWFFSGVVMMYVGYPKLTPQERLRALPALDLGGACCVGADAAMRAAGLGAGTHEVKLAMVGEEPVWLVSGHQETVAVAARTGAKLAPATPARALLAADKFLPGQHPALMGTVREDIFTASRALDAYRPLLRVALQDPAGTEVYVSQKTGEVVRDSTRRERGWNYAGSIAHYIYPLRGGVFDKWWADIIIYLSLAGTIATVIGLWLGLLRWRFAGRYKSGARTPYKDFMMKWHHLTGLLFGAVTLTWVFSGLMSMNPWKVFEQGGPKTDTVAFQGGSLHLARPALDVRQALALADGLEVREIALQVFDGRSYYVLYSAGGATRVLRADADAGGGPRELLTRFPEPALRAAAARLLPGYAVQSVEMLGDYDFYYYQRDAHAMLGHIERRLPVLRVKFNDPAGTWFHVDPYTGAVHNRIDAGRRGSRVWFALLHSWDFPKFIDMRPLWDGVMIFLSVGGFALCVTSVVIGWRRLRLKAGHGRAKRA